MKRWRPGMLRQPAGAVVSKSIRTSRSREGRRFAWSSISRFARPKRRCPSSAVASVRRSSEDRQCHAGHSRATSGVPGRASRRTRRRFDWFRRCSTTPARPSALPDRPVCFPQTVVRTCIVHLIRNSLAFVSWKDRPARPGNKYDAYTPTN
jgi:hypothetical protein